MAAVGWFLVYASKILSALFMAIHGDGYITTENAFSLIRGKKSVQLKPCWIPPLPSTAYMYCDFANKVMFL